MTSLAAVKVAETLYIYIYIYIYDKDLNEYEVGGLNHIMQYHPSEKPSDSPTAAALLLSQRMS